MPLDRASSPKERSASARTVDKLDTSRQTKSITAPVANPILPWNLLPLLRRWASRALRASDDLSVFCTQVDGCLVLARTRAFPFCHSLAISWAPWNVVSPVFNTWCCDVIGIYLITHFVIDKTTLFSSLSSEDPHANIPSFAQTLPSSQWHHQAGRWVQ